MPNRSRTASKTSSLWLPAVVAALWSLSVACQSSRIVLLNPYHVRSTLPPELEPFGLDPAVLPIILLVVSAWLMLVRQSTAPGGAVSSLAAASAPLLLWFLRLVRVIESPPIFAELLWLSGWTGFSFFRVLSHSPNVAHRTYASWFGQHGLRYLLYVGVAVCTAWWYLQACWYYDNFLLGYNDFGHFVQRVSNTLSGQGWLIETPVLPRFWDHFNPGLLLLLPFWTAWPDVHQVFAWQALALSMGGYLIYRIALALSHSTNCAALFGLAWLAQPSLGQMNLAYTYGWHPITMAIPLLLGGIWALLANRKWIAGLCCCLALSMEEGVFVIVCLTALVCAGWLVALKYGPQAWTKSKWLDRPVMTFALSLPAGAWMLLSLTAALAFFAVFRWSGLAEFQTGRFVSLGSTTLEVLLSPILRPGAFWGSLFSPDRWYFLALLLLPCGLFAVGRGAIYLLPTLLPLGVLMVWDHRPAHCIAFQYPATLLPLFWLAALCGTALGQVTNRGHGTRWAAMALSTGIVLSLFVGQLPFSGFTLMDVVAQTYGADSPDRRNQTQPDGRWLHQQITELRNQRPTVLATGRIAAHFVGMPDLETVGQYSERRERLAERYETTQPISRYELIILDRMESFQQTREQIDAVESEAKSAGFLIVAEQFEIVIMQRSESSSR